MHVLHSHPPVTGFLNPAAPQLKEEDASFFSEGVVVVLEGWDNEGVVGLSSFGVSQAEHLSLHKVGISCTDGANLLLFYSRPVPILNQANLAFPTSCFRLLEASRAPIERRSLLMC